MRLVCYLRELWRLRLAVLVVGLLAVLTAVCVAFHVPSLQSRKQVAWVASARILVDTPSSQVLDVAPKGSDTLAARAGLIASLMTDGVVKAAIAQRAGLRDDDLQGVGASATPPAGTADPTDTRSRPHVLTTRVVTTPQGDQLPIVELEAKAPDARGAATLARAAVDGMSAYLASKAATERIPDARRLRVSGLGMSDPAQLVSGPGLGLAIFLGLLVLGLGCGGILAAVTVSREWRLAAAEERQRSAAAASEPRAPLELVEGAPGDSGQRTAI